jgi:hypothetical protein
MIAAVSEGVAHRKCLVPALSTEVTSDPRDLSVSISGERRSVCQNNLPAIRNKPLETTVPNNYRISCSPCPSTVITSARTTPLYSSLSTGTPGRGDIPSALTPSRRTGPKPSPLTMVEVICRVETNSPYWLGLIEGLDTEKATSRSTPPCSAILLPVVKLTTGQLWSMGIAHPQPRSSRRRQEIAGRDMGYLNR